MEILYPPYPAPLFPRPTADNPSVKITAGAEIFPIVEPSGIVTGRMARTYAHGGAKMLHPVVHLHIINRQGQLYLQKRSMKKDLLPGFWDTAVGGHVVYGEYLREALFRESAEELHLRDYNPVSLCSYVFESETEKELVNVYACVGNFSPQPDLDEVEEGRYWEMEEIGENFGKSVFTPNFEVEFVRIRKALEALL